MTAYLAFTVEELESRLRRPDAGENGYHAGKEIISRLEALRLLKEHTDRGQVSLTGRRGGINTHVHTSKSFSIFASPSEAVWKAFRNRIAVFGINDHYTIAGHEEFAQACRTLGIAPIFSMEAVAMWEEAERLGQTVNDPRNPGRTYITAKGVTRPFPPGCGGEQDLNAMNKALLKRNREITRKLAYHIWSQLGIQGSIAFLDVLALTPHGQPTERHIAEAAARFLEKRFPGPADRAQALGKLVGEAVDAAILEQEAAFQDFIRDRLIKAGRPCYVEESRDAFIPVERMVSMALDLGAIPTYPVLLNPITPWESDIEELFDCIEPLGIHAVEVIPDRSTPERLEALVAAAERRGFPVFNGSEHNTKTPAPLVDRFCFDESLRRHFVLGARVLLGHQNLVARGEPGFVQPDGSRPEADRRTNIERAARAAGIDLSC